MRIGKTRRAGRGPIIPLCGRRACDPRRRAARTTRVGICFRGLHMELARLLALALVSAALIALPTVQPQAAQPAAAWKLTWSDEFDGKEIDKAKWDFET